MKRVLLLTLFAGLMLGQNPARGAPAHAPRTDQPRCNRSADL